MGVASDITSATYEISGINCFDVSEILARSEFLVYDKRKEEDIDVRDKIKNLYFDGDRLYAELSFGNVTLRPDYFIESLLKLYGGNHPFAVKKSVKFLSGLAIDEYLDNIVLKNR